MTTAAAANIVDATNGVTTTINTVTTSWIEMSQQDSTLDLVNRVGTRWQRTPQV